MKGFCRKWKVKLIFEAPEFMTRPDWPWPPYFTTDLRHWGGVVRDPSMHELHATRCRCLYIGY